MTTKPTIGHVDCPICGHTGAEVKPDKNERAYIHCKFACGWQGITRSGHQSDQLKARMRPVTVPTVTLQETAPPPAAPVAKPAPRPPGAAAAAAQPKTARAAAVPPAPKPASAPWLSTILGGASNG